MSYLDSPASSRASQECDSDDDNASRYSELCECPELSKHDKQNFVRKLFNRQMFGSFAGTTRRKTFKPFPEIPDRCHYKLSEILPDDNEEILGYIVMGFSQCGRFLITYSHTGFFDYVTNMRVNYTVHIWSYVPNRAVRKVADYNIFRHYKSAHMLDVTMCQWPSDYEKLVVFGTSSNHQSEAYLTIITLPSMRKCHDCFVEANKIKDLRTGQEMTETKCVKHGVSIDALLTLTPPYPKFKPEISLAHPDYIILNTGHFFYALNVAMPAAPNEPATSIALQDPGPSCSYVPECSPYNFPDNMSDISESVGSVKYEQELLDLYQLELANFSDISDCETETNEHKPFHELNISCEPLNVYGRNYRQFTSDTSTGKLESNKPQLRMFLHKNNEIKTENAENLNKSAEKAYEFTEETEKFEMLSSFRKRRLAEKKYEFSEDNSENIIPPFSLLRKQRALFKRGNQMSWLRVSCQSPDTARHPASPFSPPFLSPRNSNNDSADKPFSPVRSPSTSRLRNYAYIPCYSKLVSPVAIQNASNSPLSDAARFNPNFVDGDADDKLKFRNRAVVSKSLEIENPCDNPSNDLLTVSSDSLKDPCVREFIRRYSAIDFETTSSRLSETDRNDFVSVELPVIVHTLSCGEECNLDVVPNNMSSDLTVPFITITHRIFDAEQFCHREAKRICSENDLVFNYCQDYDMEIVEVCPLSGVVTCTAYIEVGADVIGKLIPTKSRMYVINFLFTWDASQPGGGGCSIVDKNPNFAPLNAAFDAYVAKVTCKLDQIPQRVPTKKINVLRHVFDQPSVSRLINEEHLIHISLDNGYSPIFSVTHPGEFESDSIDDDDDLE